MNTEGANEFKYKSISSFSIRIKFERNSRDPERIFASMAGLIKSMQVLDAALGHCVSARLTPEYILEDIETQSLRANLRTFFESFDDDHLLDLDWKRIVGSFIVKGKHKILKRLEERPLIIQVEQVEEIARDIEQLAAESGALQLPGYKALSHHEVLTAISQIAVSREVLSDSDSVEYLCGEDSIDVKKMNVISMDEYDAQSLDTIYEGEHEETLKIRKPDFIGNTSWGFMRKGKNVAIKVVDGEWLHKFRDGDVTLRPGDMMRVRIKEGVRKNRRSGAIESTEIIKTVHEVYRNIQKKIVLPI